MHMHMYSRLNHSPADLILLDCRTSQAPPLVRLPLSMLNVALPRPRVPARRAVCRFLVLLWGLHPMRRQRTCASVPRTVVACVMICVVFARSLT